MVQRTLRLTQFTGKVASLRQNPPCIWDEYPLPRKNCTMNTMLSWAIQSLQIFLGSDTRFTLVPVDGYSPGPFLNDSSIISTIHRGDADISAPFISLSEQRYKYVNWGPVSKRDSLALIWLKPPPKGKALTSKRLFPPMMLQTLAFWLVLVAANKFASRKSNRLAVISGLSLEVLLEMINAALTNHFNSPTDDKPIFSSSADVINKLGNFRVLHQSNYMLEILRPVAKFEGVKIAQIDRMIARFMADASDDRPFLMALTGFARDMTLPRICQSVNVETYTDPSFPAGQDRVVYADELIPVMSHLTEAEGLIAQTDFKRHVAAELPSRHLCKHPEPVRSGSSIHELVIVFVGFALTLMVVFGLCLGELCFCLCQTSTRLN